MGKAQKKRAIRHRHNPIRVPDSHLPPGLAAASESADKDKRDAVLPIIQKVSLSCIPGYHMIPTLTVRDHFLAMHWSASPYFALALCFRILS